MLHNDADQKRKDRQQPPTPLARANKMVENFHCKNEIFIKFVLYKGTESDVNYMRSRQYALQLVD